jgi:hypothetical protein
MKFLKFYLPFVLCNAISASQPLGPEAIMKKIASDNTCIKEYHHDNNSIHALASGGIIGVGSWFTAVAIANGKGKDALFSLSTTMALFLMTRASRHIHKNKNPYGVSSSQELTQYAKAIGVPKEMLKIIYSTHYDDSDFQGKHEAIHTKSLRIAIEEYYKKNQKN